MSQFSFRNKFFSRFVAVGRVVASSALSVALLGVAVGCQGFNKCANCGAYNANGLQKALGQLPEESDEPNAVAVPVAPNEAKTSIVIAPSDGTGDYADASVAASAPNEAKTSNVVAPSDGTGDYADASVAASAPAENAVNLKMMDNTAKKVDEQTSNAAPTPSTSAYAPSESLPSDSEPSSSSNENVVAAGNVEDESGENVGEENAQTESDSVSNAVVENAPAENLQKTANDAPAQNLTNDGTTQNSGAEQNDEATQNSETTQDANGAENSNDASTEEETPNNSEENDDDLEEEDNFVRSYRGGASFQTASLNDRRGAKLAETSGRSKVVRSIPKTVAFKANATPIAENATVRVASSPVRDDFIDASTRSFPIGDPRLEAGRRGSVVSALTSGNGYITVRTEERKR